MWDMSQKFAKQVQPGARSPLQSGRIEQGLSTVSTYEGGVGFSREPRTELFLLAVSNLVGEDTFYEDAAGRDRRYADLCQKVTGLDPAWMQKFIPWLRKGANMRSASIVAAAEYADAGGPNVRRVIDSAMARADEPGEMLAYWRMRHGKHPAGGVKRGIADAVNRLYTERSALKYNGTNRVYRMADVIEITHPRPASEYNRRLIKFLRDDRFGKEQITLDQVPVELGIIRGHMAWEQAGHPLPEPGQQLPLGVTWEELSSYHKTDAKFWEAMIPNMGYMALLRNLRNFDEAGISDAAARSVENRLANPLEVSKSRQFPLRFLSAWVASKSMMWGNALERALQESLDNLPLLAGRTLILIDCSGSMFGRGGWGLSQRGSMLPYQSAGVFGFALANRAESADTYVYGNGYTRVAAGRGQSVLRMVEQLQDLGGTETWQTLNATYQGHDRVVILTDEQAFSGEPNPSIKCPVYTFNLVGYNRGWASGQSRGGGRSADLSNYMTFGGGLTDASFRLLNLLETRGHGSWPWEES
jgi:hypothetical protein